MDSHSRLAPSSMGQIMLCTGSLTMQEAHPQSSDNQAALEGTTAHWVAANLLKGTPVAIGEICLETNLPVDEEMYEAAEMYATVVGSKRLPTLHVEEPVTCPRIHRQMRGTPDAWGVVEDTIHIYDFKYGHSFVEVFENWQMICYLSGILDALGVDGHSEQFWKVVFTIVQPRSYHVDGPVRTWVVKAVDLRAQYNLLSMKCLQALSASATCMPHPDACRDCSARHACSALQRAALVAVEHSTRAVPFDLPPVAVGHELRTMQRTSKLMEARLSGLEEQARSMLQTGQSVPFYHLEAGRGKTVWRSPDAEVIAMGRMMQVDLARPPTAITPVQAKSKGSFDLALLESMTEKRAGEMKVTPDNSLSVRKAFL